MKKKVQQALSLCMLFLLCTAMSCDEDVWEDALPNEIKGLSLTHYDNSGAHPVSVSNGRCPKEAYVLRIQPLWSFNYSANSMDPPVARVRIITLTDFNADYPAGSDISRLFIAYPHRLQPDVTPYDPFEEGGPIYHLDDKAAYRMLNVIPAPGEYRFRVEFHFAGSYEEPKDPVTEETSPIYLY